MARVLLVGIDPDSADFSDPALPPGLNADIIRKGVAAAIASLRTGGHEVRHTHLPIRPDAAVSALDALLNDAAFDCVAIGGGVHRPLSNRPLFEALLNTIGRRTPTPAIALLARPEDAEAGVARVLG